MQVTQTPVVSHGNYSKGTVKLHQDSSRKHFGTIFSKLSYTSWKYQSICFAFDFAQLHHSNNVNWVKSIAKISCRAPLRSALTLLPTTIGKLACSYIHTYTTIRSIHPSIHRSSTFPNLACRSGTYTNHTNRLWKSSARFGRRCRADDCVAPIAIFIISRYQRLGCLTGMWTSDVLFSLLFCMCIVSSSALSHTTLSTKCFAWWIGVTEWAHLKRSPPSVPDFAGDNNNNENVERMDV